MSSGAKVISAFIRETVAGTTPASGDWSLLKRTSWGVKPTQNKGENNEIGGSRMAQGATPGTVDVGGDVGTKFRWGLPANSTDIAPPDIPAGFVAVFNSDEASWHLVEDHRGKTVYDVASGDALFISELGPLPENVTWLSPGGEYQKWNGTAWVKDAEAEKLFRIREAEETKNSLMQVASEHIAPLQDAADLEIATEEETSLLEAWKKYRVLLNRVNTTTAPDIEWPTVPIIE
nr:phage tail tube protein [Escherichia coli]